MKTLPIEKSAKGLLVAIVIAAMFGGCSISRKQPPENANANASATPAAQPTPAAAKAKPKHAMPSAEASTKSNSSAILSQIHQANLKEIALARIAEQKASTDEVRQYASQLIGDDTGADRSVVEIAQKTHVHLRDTASRRKSTHSKLNSATGAEFDQHFLTQVSSDHNKLISSLKQEREDTTDDKVEALIDKILPIFEQQQQLAQMLIKKEQA